MQDKVTSLRHTQTNSSYSAGSSEWNGVTVGLCFCLCVCVCVCVCVFIGLVRFLPGELTRYVCGSGLYDGTVCVRECVVCEGPMR